MKIIFFGTPPFSAYVLDNLIKKGQKIVAVVTRPDRPKGRSKKNQPSAVKSLCLEKYPNIPLFQPEKASTPQFEKKLSTLNSDVFVVVAYGEILKQNILDIPKIMPINIHASLLPKYRGAAPIQRAIINGEKETGITIMEMVLEMDAGPILDVEKVLIEEEMIFKDLEEALCRISIPVLEKTLIRLEKKDFTKTSQDHDQATIAPKILLADRMINWKESAQKNHNQIRGLSPFPGAFTFVQTEGGQKRLGIKRSKIYSGHVGNPGETLLLTRNKWIVACGEGALSLLEVQLEGKKNLDITSFLRGQSQPIFIKVD